MTSAGGQIVPRFKATAFRSFSQSRERIPPRRVVLAGRNCPAFASGLLACQNWTPYAGSLPWQEEECGSRRYLGRVVNVTNARAVHADMLATVVAEELDLDSGITTLTLGTPAKLAFLSVIDKQRTHSAQQTAYL